MCCLSVLLQGSALSDQMVCLYCFGMENNKGSFCKEGLEKASLVFHQGSWKPSFPTLSLPQSHPQNAHLFLALSGKCQI